MSSKSIEVPHRVLIIIIIIILIIIILIIIVLIIIIIIIIIIINLNVFTENGIRRFMKQKLKNGRGGVC